MPDTSRHAAVLQGLESNTLPTLGVSIGPITVTPGQKIDRKDTQSIPTLTVPHELQQASYTAICLDLDAPFMSWNPMSPIAHWIQTDLKVSSSGESLELKSDKPPVGPWVPAAPPPGAAPHRYLLFLYEQQSTTSPITKLYSTMQRIRVDVDSLTKQLNLGKIVAANYFFSN